MAIHCKRHRYTSGASNYPTRHIKSHPNGAVRPEISSDRFGDQTGRVPRQGCSLTFLDWCSGMTRNLADQPSPRKGTTFSDTPWLARLDEQVSSSTPLAPVSPYSNYTKDRSYCKFKETDRLIDVASHETSLRSCRLTREDSVLLKVESCAFANHPTPSSFAY